MKIGILGGTFDPIHFGHINPLLEVKRALELDQVWLMPNHIPPHKQQPNSTTAHRLAMTHLVCQQYPEFTLCDIEAKRDTPSYSVTTLQVLKQEHPNDQLLFIMGMDSFINLPKWYQWQQLFELCHIVVYQRPGWNIELNPQMQQLLTERQGDKATLQQNNPPSCGLIFPIEITQQPYSSTDIRSQLADQQLKADALPQIVIDYIRQHNLYN